MAKCKSCGNMGCRSSDLVNGECAGCRGEYTLPADEWAEMSAAEKKSARAAGITPEYSAAGEDYRQQQMDQSSQSEGPRG